MLKAFVLGIVLTVIAIIVAGYAVVTSGTVPAAANGHPVFLENWAARTSLRATLNRDAPKGPNPVALTPANLIAGIQLYGQNCAVCHGTAKGAASASPIAKGEYPAPPQLAAHGVEDDPPGWTFWKLQNGIRWSGMPSWKDTLSTRQMWTLALFLKHMDKLPPDAEKAWQALANEPPSAAPGAAK